MASAPPLHIGVSPPTPRLWPESAARRWAARLALAVPLIVVAVVADRRAGTSTEHTLLLEQSRRAWSGDFAAVQWAYPPIPTLIASVVDSALVLSIAGALLGGVAGFVIVQRMCARGLPVWLQVMLVGGIALVPSTWYVCTQDIAGMMGLALLVIALDGFERFAMEAETLGGFATGLALGAAVLCDPSATIYAIALAVAAPLVALPRYRGEGGVGPATVLVFAFPTAAALVSWAYIEWRFTGSAFQGARLDGDLFEFEGGWWSALRRSQRERNLVLAHTPLYLAVGVVMARRRPLSMLAAYILPLFLLMVARFVGLAYPQMLGVVLLATIAAMTIPEGIHRRDRVVIAAGAVVQLVVSLVWLPSAGIVEPWLRQLW